MVHICTPLPATACNYAAFWPALREVTLTRQTTSGQSGHWIKGHIRSRGGAVPSLRSGLTLCRPIGFVWAGAGILGGEGLCDSV